MGKSKPGAARSRTGSEGNYLTGQVLFANGMFGGGGIANRGAGERQPWHFPERSGTGCGLTGEALCNVPAELLLWRQASRLRFSLLCARIPATIGDVIKDRPRRLDLLYISRPLYFVTFCTRDRRPMPSLEQAQVALERYAQRGLSEFNVSVGRYVLMPDHIHLFVGGGPDFLLSRWIAGLKRAISLALEIRGEFWQPGFFDHLIRSEESYRGKWQYVCDNPVRAGLAAESSQWPFQGQVATLDRL